MQGFPREEKKSEIKVKISPPPPPFWNSIWGGDLPQLTMSSHLPPPPHLTLSPTHLFSPPPPLWEGCPPIRNSPTENPEMTN